MAFECQAAQHFQAIRVSSDPSRNGSHGVPKKKSVLKSNNRDLATTNHTHQGR
jgi:hypothetical protein